MPVPAAATTSASSAKNLWTAASEGDLERVKHLIETEGFTATSPDPNTYTPLHAASSYGHLDLLRYLLNLPSSQGDNDAVNVTDEDGDTPLFVAETVETAKCLIDEFGADPKHKNKAGETAAETAEENEHPELAAYLRGLTGEEPLYQNPSQEGDEEDQEGAEGTGNAELDAALDEKTEELMSRVRAIMERAQARGAASGDDLTPEEEEELKKAVGEQLMTQIKEGWVQSQDEEDEGAAVNTEGDKGASVEGQKGPSNEAQSGHEDAEGSQDTSPSGPAR